MLGIDEFEGSDIELRAVRRGSNSGGRTDQDRLDQAELRSLDCALQGNLVAGMRDRHRDAAQLSRRVDQALVFVVTALGSRRGIVRHDRKLYPGMTAGLDLPQGYFPETS